MGVKCVFRNSKENINAYIEKNKGLIIIYGAAYWGGKLADSSLIKPDCFCDRKAESPYYFHGVEVINIDELEHRVNESGKRATIIICTGLKRKIVCDIFIDLVKRDVDADVFDYFENTYVFSDSKFILNHKSYDLFEHPYNCGYANTRMTERSVELPLALEYINKCNGNIVEVGAVTPYYFSTDKIEEVIDPTDVHKVVTKKSVFDCDLRGRNVLSISTVEHIGTSDYGMNEKLNVLDALKKILTESSSCLITAPMGYNKLLDEWIKENWDNDEIKMKALRRQINNHWGEMNDEYTEVEYTELWADGVVIIAK